MIEKQLGKLEKVDPKTIWLHEAHEFTPWLAANLGELNEKLGIEIELIDREVSVGDFAVDIFGKEVGSGQEVIIENQLAPTDHTHLGQLLTYAAGLDAKIVVWISPVFRDEHKQALDWLNRGTTDAQSFFGVELELFRIGDSLPAPNFKVVAQPSEWQEAVVTSVRGEVSDRKKAYQEFFADFLTRLRQRNPGFTNASPDRVRYDNWLSIAAGRAGFVFQPEFMRNPDRFVIQLNITTGNRDRNKLAFDQLYDAKDEIERAFGRPLEWRRLDEKKECRIGIAFHGGVDSPADRLEQVKTEAVETLISLGETLRPRVRALDLGREVSEGFR